MSPFAEIQHRADEWNVVLQFLDAQDWMRLEYRGRAYHARRVLTDEELAWFRAKNISVKLLETSAVEAWGVHTWYQNGQRHRDGDRPAVVGADGTQIWLQNGRLHRDGDRPAVVGPTGRQAWYQNGQLHRDGDQPAYIEADGTRHWYRNGLKHRDGDLPAVVEADGTQEWFQNGRRHRDGARPARVDADGTQEWYQNDCLCTLTAAGGRQIVWAEPRRTTRELRQIINS